MSFLSLGDSRSGGHCAFFSLGVILKKTLGRLAGAVLAGALLTLTVSPAALAEEAPSTSTATSAPSSSAAPTTTEAPTSSSAPTSEQPTTTEQPTSTSAPTGTGTPTSGKPTETSAPTETSDPLPHGDDYIDGVAYAWEFEDGTGLLAIACAAGEPKDVRSEDFTVVDGPFQDGADGRYWGFDIKFKEGRHPGDGKASWTCEGKPETKPVAPGGGSATVGGQVKVTPKNGGVETGGGATARS